MFVCSKQQLKGSVCVSFSSVWSIVSFRHGESVENILFNPLRDLVRLLFDSPPKKNSNNNHNNAKEFLTGGLSHHLFACHAQQLQNVYNRRSVIFLWGVFSFFFNSCLSFSAHLLCCVCRGWYATWALLTSDVVTDHKKVPVDEEPPVKPKQQQQQQQQLLSLSQMLERGRRLHSLRLWVASFRKPPPIFRCCH